MGLREPLTSNKKVFIMNSISREKMIGILKENKVDVIGLSEEFDGSKGGIWINGEGGDRRLDYWTENYEDFTFGIHNSLDSLVGKYGWFFEWYDAGTLMCHPE
jgi:hypothetical protein